MKNKILFIFTISLIIFSCSSFEDYDEKNIQSEEIIDKVKELAYDYGINITINEDAIRTYPEGLNLDSVNRMFSEMKN